MNRSARRHIAYVSCLCILALWLVATCSVFAQIGSVNADRDSSRTVKVSQRDTSVWRKDDASNIVLFIGRLNEDNLADTILGKRGRNLQHLPDCIHWGRGRGEQH